MNGVGQWAVPSADLVVKVTRRPGSPWKLSFCSLCLCGAQEGTKPWCSWNDTEDGRGPPPWRRGFGTTPWLLSPRLGPTWISFPGSSMVC